MTRTRLLVFGGTLTVLVLIGCGGGGGGGGQVSTIKGDVATASTASLERRSRGWLAWVGEQAWGLARAFADATLGGIRVQAGAVTGSTDDSGQFDLGGAPTGDVTVTFSRGGCEGEVVLPDVTAGSTLKLHAVAFDCTGARPSKVTETFQAVIINKPASPNGNLNVCVASGGGHRTRVVKIKDAAIKDATGNPADFSNLAEGDLIEASGDREGLGASSALDASTVTILGAGNPVSCQGQATPTPAATETPEPTATPTPTP